MTREELKAKIPHGSMQAIAEKAGVNRITVGSWFSGKTNNTNIELAVLEVVADIEEKRKALLARIQ